MSLWACGGGGSNNPPLFDFRCLSLSSSPSLLFASNVADILYLCPTFEPKQSQTSKAPKNNNTNNDNKAAQKKP